MKGPLPMLLVFASSTLAVSTAQGPPPGGMPQRQGPGANPTHQQPSNQNPNQQPTNDQAQPFVPGTQLPGATDPRQVKWGLPPVTPPFQGFPVFPSQLSGYGTTYPNAAGRPGALLPQLPLAPAPDGPPGWPAWVRTREKEPLPFAPDLALLVRHVDRVWMRTTAEEPFVPLFFHDKLRTLQTGAVVEVRQNGEFELLLHDSSRMVARGPSTIELGKLNDTEVNVRVTVLTWLRIRASGRQHNIELPDGSMLSIAPPPKDPAPALVPSLLPTSVPMSDPTSGMTDLLMVRADEPAWMAGRATMTNLGHTEVRWTHASGEVVLAPSQRVIFFLQGHRQVVPTGLVVAGADSQTADSAVVCRSQGAGSASWCGAAFELPAGASVRFDPQQGRPFERPAAKPTPAPKVER